MIFCPPICSFGYATGAQLTLLAFPARGSTFAGWSGGVCAGSRACRLSVETHATLTAIFKRKPHLRIRRVRSRAVRSSCGVTRKSAIASMARARSCAGLAFVIGGTIARQARGVVRLKVRAGARGHRVVASRRARIRGNRWQARLVLPRVNPKRRAAALVTARFGGNAAVGRGHAKRQVGAGDGRSRRRSLRGS